MRILFVAMSHSVHTARWLKQLAGTGWDLHLFPSWGEELHQDLENLTVHAPSGFCTTCLSPSVRVRGRLPRPIGRIRNFARTRLLPRLGLARRVLDPFCDESKRLARLIRRLRPDIVHSLEIQHSGYLTLNARDLLPSFPTWIVTNWGADIHLFGRLPEHAARIKKVLAACDYYDCESHRDVRLARQMGFDGPVLPVLPNGGGFDLEYLRSLRSPGPTSARRLILLKGYQGWVYRALVGVRAIQMSADALRGYRVGIYLGNADVQLAAVMMSQATDIPVDFIPHSSHEEMLRFHGRARMSIGLSISDGCSTSFLEALAMGSFPIQSSSASADEWVRHGESGMLVQAEDPHDVAAAIRRAATDDGLVDRAAEINARTAADRLEYHAIQREVIGTYEAIAARRLGAASPHSARAAA